MSNLIPFSYQGRPVRTIVINGETHFVAKDICDILEISDTSKAVSRLSDSMKGTNSIPTLGGSQEMLTVTEAGVYKLVFSSRKPEAEQFTDWIASDVLPSIRKTGGYMVLPKTLPEALRAYADEVETRMLAEAKAKELQPKADFFDAVADGNQITRSKPDPEVFLLAARLLGLPAADCLVVEDADAGVEAALAGGMKALGVGSAASNPRATYRAADLAAVTLDTILA